MKIDLTYPLTKEKIEEFTSKLSERDKNIMAMGHIGTHFDAMEKKFPLDYGERRGIIFDVSKISGREIKISDIDADKIQSGDFVLLYTGVIEKFDYGTEEYFKNNPELSWDLIENFVEKKISLVGVDNCGVRHGCEHAKADKFFADNDTFVIENLVNLDKIIFADKKIFQVHTYPLNLINFSGIPSRVIAEI